MAMIIYTCPRCGTDLIDTVICTYPPKVQKWCPSCGWRHTEEREEVIRVPFGGNLGNGALTEPILRETMTVMVDGNPTVVYKDEIEKQLYKSLYSHLGLQYGG